MDADQQQHQSSSVIKQSITKLRIKLNGNIIQPQQQCSSSKEAEVVVMNNMSVSKSISNNSDSSLSTTCLICGKSFPSKQSLFGHMRSHPEREWRGIQPPPPPPSSPPQSQPLRFLIKKSSSSSTGSDDSCKSAESYQGVGPLPVKWSATGKRGRVPYGSFLSSDQRISDAVDGLLMLKEGNDLDVDADLMNKQISRETEGISTSKKRSSEEEEVSRSSDLLRSSKKIKIDQERSFSQLEQLPSSLDCGLVKNKLKKLKLDEGIGCSCSMFYPKLMNSIPSSSHLEQWPLIGFHGDMQNSSKKAKLIASSSLPSSSSSHVPHMPLPNGSHSIPSSSSSSHVPHMPPSHVPHMPLPNGSHSIPSSSSSSHIPHMPPSHVPHMPLPNGSHSIPSSSCSSHIPRMPPSHVPHMPPNGSHSIPSSSNHGIPYMPPPNGYYQGEFNSGFTKPAILSKAATTNKKKIDQRADRDMGLQGSCSTNEFKCDTCNRTFPSHQALGGHKSSQRNCKNNSSSSSSSSSSYQYPTHDHQYLLCRESISKMMIQAAADPEHPKIPKSYPTHICEVCGDKFFKGQALGGHKRKHYTGYSSGTTAAPHCTGYSSCTTAAPVEKLIKKEMMNSLSVVDPATAASSSSSVGEEVISTTTTTTTTKTENKPPPRASSSSVGEEVISTTTTTTPTKTENKPPPRVLDFDLNELPDES